MTRMKSVATLILDYDSVTEDIEIKAYYKPIKVNFAVKYYFQNIHDDLYAEDASRYHTDKAETGTIVTNEYLRAMPVTQQALQRCTIFPKMLLLTEVRYLSVIMTEIIISYSLTLTAVTE